VNAMTPTARTPTTRSVRSRLIGPFVREHHHGRASTPASAVGVELDATVPPYLCALPRFVGSQSEVVEIMRSVFVEMLPPSGGNLLNAVGGRPQIDTPQMLAPTHERYLRRQLVRGLAAPVRPRSPRPLSEDPAAFAAAQIRRATTTSGGQFYGAIRSGMRELFARLGGANVFRGDPRRQVSSGLPWRSRAHGDQRSRHRARCVGRIVVRARHEGSEIWDGDREMFHEHDEVGLLPLPAQARPVLPPR
jgi:hypothetical protein